MTVRVSARTQEVVFINTHLLYLHNACMTVMVSECMTVTVDARLQEVVVINTHLLYPHNACSTIIRLREVHKILEYLQARSTLLDSTLNLH